MVDLLVPVRGDVHRSDLPRAHPPGIRRGRAARTGGGICYLVRHFGGSALNYISTGRGGGLAGADSSNALFVLLQQLPIPGIITVLASVVAIVVVVLFFATSSDSGSLVVDILTNGGDPDPLWQSRLFWAILEGAVAAVLLLVGGLAALQTASITAGLPFAVVLLFMCYGLLKGLQEERLPALVPEPATTPEPGSAMSRPGGTAASQQMTAE